MKHSTFSKLKKLSVIFLGVVTTLALVWIMLLVFGGRVAREARPEATMVQLQTTAILLNDFFRMCGKYPTTDQGFHALLVKPESLDCQSYHPILQGEDSLRSMSSDSWGEPIRYTSDGKKYRLEASNGIIKEGP